MDLSKRTDNELHRSILAEIAKANKELKDASNDVKKAQSRLSFALAILNILIERGKD